MLLGTSRRGIHAEDAAGVAVAHELQVVRIPLPDGNDCELLQVAKLLLGEFQRHSLATLPDQGPGTVGDGLKAGEIVAVVVRRLVAHADQEHHAIVAEHGDSHMASQVHMALRKASRAVERLIVVVNAGPAVPRGVGPDPGFADRVMAVINRRARRSASHPTTSPARCVS